MGRSMFLAVWIGFILGFYPPLAAIAAETAFTTGMEPFFLSKQSGSKAVGRLDVATRLEILDRTDNWLRVKVTGWHQEGGARIIFEKPGKRILALALKKSAVPHLQRLHSLVLAETELTWHEAAMTGFIRNTELTGDISAQWQSAEALFSTRCTVCHQRRTPHHYTANQWRSLIKVMGPRTGLPKPKQQLILKFLQYRASDMAHD